MTHTRAEIIHGLAEGADYRVLELAAPEIAATQPRELLPHERVVLRSLYDSQR